MNAVETILNKNHFSITVDGVEFVVRKITPQMALSVVGVKAVGIVRGAASPGGPDAETSRKFILEVMPKYLKAAMVNPALGDVTDVVTDTITIDDLGSFAVPLFNEIFEASGYGHLDDFQESSGDMKVKK